MEQPCLGYQKKAYNNKNKNNGLALQDRAKGKV